METTFAPSPFEANDCVLVEWLFNFLGTNAHNARDSEKIKMQDNETQDWLNSLNRNNHNKNDCAQANKLRTIKDKSINAKNELKEYIGKEEQKIVKWKDDLSIHKKVDSKHKNTKENLSYPFLNDFKIPHDINSRKK